MRSAIRTRGSRLPVPVLASGVERAIEPRAPAQDAVDQLGGERRDPRATARARDRAPPPARARRRRRRARRARARRGRARAPTRLAAAAPARPFAPRRGPFVSARPSRAEPRAGRQPIAGQRAGIRRLPGNWISANAISCSSSPHATTSPSAVDVADQSRGSPPAGRRRAGDDPRREQLAATRRRASSSRPARGRRRAPAPTRAAPADRSSAARPPSPGAAPASPRASSCGARVTVPVDDRRQRLDQQLGARARPASPTASRWCRRRRSRAPAPRATGPVSSPASMRMIDTPVSRSPRMIAHWIGAAPRSLGSSEACTLNGPSAADPAASAAGSARRRPPRTDRRRARASAACVSGVRIFSGCRIGHGPSASAARLTAGAAGAWPRPAGRSG